MNPWVPYQIGIVLHPVLEGDIFKNVLLCQLDVKEAVLNDSKSQFD